MEVNAVCVARILQTPVPVTAIFEALNFVDLILEFEDPSYYNTTEEAFFFHNLTKISESHEN